MLDTFQITIKKSRSYLIIMWSLKSYMRFARVCVCVSIKENNECYNKLLLKQIVRQINLIIKLF